MKRNTWRWAAGLSPVALLVVWATVPTIGQSQSTQAPKAQAARPPRPGAPPPRRRTSTTRRTANGRPTAATCTARATPPLDQINASNFNKLEVAWRFKTDMLGPRPEFQLQTTPLMVKGVLYFTAGTRRAVVALDAATGEMLWMYSMNEGKRGEAAPRQLSGRGVAYWTDGKEERIIYVTPGYQMVALNAKTGDPVPAFGKNGIVDLKENDDQPMDLVTGEVGLHSAPIIVNDVIVIGAAHLPGGVAEEQDEPEGLRARIRRAHRQAALDLPHDSASGRVRQRHVGGRLVVVHRQHRRRGRR